MNSNIKELQRYLYYISLVDTDIPRVVPDGIYGPETEDAVKAFQNEYGLPVTGVVDSVTWNMILKIYGDIMHGCSSPDPLYVFPKNGYLVTLGEKSDTVSFIQLVLKCLDSEYHFEVMITVTGIYNDRDKRAVKKLQKIHGIPQTGDVDCDTWNCMASDFTIYSQGEY